MAKTKRATNANNAENTAAINWNQLDIPCVYISNGNAEVSDAFKENFGLSELRAPKKNNDKIIPIRERALNTKALSEPGLHEGVQIDTSTGPKVIDLEVIAVRGAPDSFIAFVRNNEEKRRLEKELIESQIELRRTHEALVQSAKLASLGELASGVAHELNQPLQAVLGFSQELEAIDGVKEESKYYLTEVIHAAGKMKEIINSLRTYARNSPEERATVGIGHCVQEAIRISGHSLLQDGVEIDWQPPTQEQFIFANAIQIEQVLVNLFTNARDAIRENKKSGKVTVRMMLNSNQHPVLLVKDDGCGMSDEVRAKMFDPFYTTKAVGKGTGLGMSIVHSIANRYGIHIQVESTPDQGTTFILTFQQTLNEGEKQ